MCPVVQHYSGWPVTRDTRSHKHDAKHVVRQGVDGLAACGESAEIRECSVPPSVAGENLRLKSDLRRTPGTEPGRYRTFATD
jgi:hypothetical protein